MVSGSAPISEEVLEFLKVSFCCPVLERYCQTETCGGFLYTSPEDPSTGHVGGPLASASVRLRDIPDLNYFHSDLPYPRG